MNSAHHSQLSDSIGLNEQARDWRWTVVIGVVLIVIAYPMARVNYLLFHTLAEGFALIVAAMIFVVANRTFRYAENHFLLFLGIAYLFVSALDLVHLMTYQGMTVMPGYTSNTPTQLWIAGRLVNALALLIAPVFLVRSFPRRTITGAFAVITGLLLASILWWQIFPDCFLPDTGLTPFKIASEYFVVVVLLGAIWHLYQQRSKMDDRKYKLIVAAIVTTVLSELSFTLYSDPYGIMNFVGHALKIMAYYFIFEAIVARGLDKPYEEIRTLNDSLEQRVQERTAQLAAANGDLEREIVKRQRAEEEREQLLAEVQDKNQQLAAQNEELQAQSEEIRVQGEERERLLGEVRRRSSELETMIGSMVDAVMVCDANGHVILMNEAARKQTGCFLDGPTDPMHTISQPNQGGPELASETRQAPESTQLRVSSGPPVEADSALGRAIRGEQVVCEDTVMYDRTTGREHCLRVNATPLHDAEGAIVGAVAVSTDITELVELDRLKDEFLRVTAHELKTPLTAIKGFAQYLQRSPEVLTAGQANAVSSIERSAERMARITRDLMDVSQMQLGRFELRIEPFNLTKLVQEVTEEVTALCDHHQIVTHIGDCARIEGDRQRLGQVLVNLLSNALKYSPNGGEVEISLTTTEQQARVAIRDHGIGIPAAKQERIFERFYRAHQDTAFDYGGLGLGLHIAREIVARHEGRLWFESEEGQGSTFTLELPLSEAIANP